LARKKLAVIGTGNMGSAILHGVIGADLFEADDVIACDLVAEKVEALARALGIDVAPTASDAASTASTVLLAVKPQTMGECLSEVKEAVGPAHLIISIAAGITTGFIEERLGPAVRVVRVMPNTPALVGAGASALCSGTHATNGDLAEAERIFGALGTVYNFDESLMDAVTAVSGSGPAYLFLFAECLAGAALTIGLPGNEAAGLVAQTLFGASKLLVESGEPASALRAKVTSPGGTTEAAVSVFNERGFEEIVVAAVSSAFNRAKELGGARNS
jgi:pyrroline-5-carboxylate reductase